MDEDRIFFSGLAEKAADRIGACVERLGLGAAVHRWPAISSSAADGGVVFVPADPAPAHGGFAGTTVAVGEDLTPAEQAASLDAGADEVIDLAWPDRLIERRVSHLLENLRLRRRIDAELSAKRRELADARTLQLALVPKAMSGRPTAVDVVLEPAMELGGDLVDYVVLRDGRLMLALGDVSGKGAAAALTMARTHTLLRSLALRSYAGDLLSPPDTAAHRLNGMLAIDNEGCMFVTMFLGLLDPTTGELAYVRCGHIPPFLRRRDGSVERLDAVGGPPLGVMEDVRYDVGRTTVGPGERLLIVSDGVTEAENDDAALLGEAPVAEWLGAGEQDLAHLVGLARRHEAGRPPSDDLAALLVRRADA